MGGGRIRTEVSPRGQGAQAPSPQSQASETHPSPTAQVEPPQVQTSGGPPPQLLPPPSQVPLPMHMQTLFVVSHVNPFVQAPEHSQRPAPAPNDESQTSKFGPGQASPLPTETLLPHSQLPLLQVSSESQIELESHSHSLLAASQTGLSAPAHASPLPLLGPEPPHRQPTPLTQVSPAPQALLLASAQTHMFETQSGASAPVHEDPPPHSQTPPLQTSPASQGTPLKPQPQLVPLQSGALAEVQLVPVAPHSQPPN